MGLKDLVDSHGECDPVMALSGSVGARLGMPHPNRQVDALFCSVRWVPGGGASLT